MKGITNVKLIDAKTGQVKMEHREENAIGPAYQEFYQWYVDNYRSYLAINAMSANPTAFAMVNWASGIGLLEDLQPDAPYENVAKGKIIGVGGTGNACDTYHDKCGNRMTYDLQSNSLTQMWQWNTTQGNGTFNCISLGKFAGLCTTAPNPWVSASLTAYPPFKYNGTASNTYSYQYMICTNPVNGRKILRSQSGNDYYKHFHSTPAQIKFDEAMEMYYDFDTSQFFDMELVYCYAQGFGSDGYYYVHGRLAADGHRYIYRIDVETDTILSRNKIQDNVTTSAYYWIGQMIGDYIYYQDYDQNTTSVFALRRIKVTDMGTDTDESANVQELILDQTQHITRWLYFEMTETAPGIIAISYAATVTTSTSARTKYHQFYEIDEATFTVMDFWNGSSASLSSIYWWRGGWTGYRKFWDYFCTDLEYDSPSAAGYMQSRTMLTINNLGAPITKTSADILQIEYTLEW